MCGIGGCYRPTQAPDRTSLVGSITAAQRRRGPDNEAVATFTSQSSTVTFGHNRLKIIDVSDAANQPMWDGASEVCIVFNGEIYNYVELRKELTDLGSRFRTQSDTEVILEAFKQWGADAFGRLNGMFAFAIFDSRDGRLWLVRDRFGVKPLFFSLARDCVVFASTPGPIARGLGLGPDLMYVARGLRYWVYEDDSRISPYEGVEALPPGHYLTAQLGPGGAPQTTIGRWYDFATRVESKVDDVAHRSDEALVDEFRSLLEQAISLRLRADVRIGISISGGLDSSTIASMVARDGDIDGFSFGDPQDPASEGGSVHHLAESIGIKVKFVSWPQDGIPAFWAALDGQDAPFPDLSVVAQFLVFREAHRAGYKVLLGGQGADEMLMGYRKFQLLLLRDAVRSLDARATLRGAASIALMLAAEARSASTYWRQRERYFRRGGLRPLLTIPEPPLLNLMADGRTARQRQFADIGRFSLPTLLRYEDRNSMANSLETRLPFLDFALAEFSAALPEALKIRRGYGKWVLREAMRDRLPARTRLTRAKRGFDAPTRSWIHGGLGEEIRQALRAQRSAVDAWLPASGTVERLFADDRLTNSPTAIAEATSLLWLARQS